MWGVLFSRIIFLNYVSSWEEFREIVSLAYIEVKVKCIVVQALRLCTGRTARRGSRGIAPPFHDYIVKVCMSLEYFIVRIIPYGAEIAQLA
jgi:hypothetical protein